MINNKKKILAVIKDDMINSVQLIFKLGGLLISLALAILAIVVPLTFLAQNNQVIFRIISIFIIIGITFFLLKRKYSNMKILELNNTRNNKESEPFIKRYLYSILLKPVLVIIVLIIYMIIFYTMTFNFLAAFLIFFFYTFGLILSIKHFRGSNQK